MKSSFNPFSLRTWPTLLMLAFTLVAIALRAAVPAGYMPSYQNDGVFEMVICTSSGSETVLVDKNMQPVTHDTNAPSHSMDDHNGICDFALNTYHTASVDNPYVLDIPAFYAAIEPQGRYATTVFAHFFGNYGSRAPPVSYV